MAKRLPSIHPCKALREDFLRPMKLSPSAVARVRRTRIEERSSLYRRSYILNTPHLVLPTRAFSAAENASASTRRVSCGVMIPSSHSRAVA
jgi:hypothetical protein